MTHDDLPISYRAAHIALQSGVVALRSAGPAACKLSPSIYVPLLEHIEKAAEVFRILEELRAKQAEKRASFGRARA